MNKESPDFHSKYKSCEALLTLEFNKLDVSLHQEALQELMSFANELQNQMKLLSSDIGISQEFTTQSSTFKRTLSTLSENLPSMTDNRKIKRLKKGKTSMKIETIIFKLIAQLDALTVKLLSDTSDIAKFDIKGVHSEVIVKKSYTHITAKLMDVAVIDLNPKTFHSKVCLYFYNNVIFETYIFLSLNYF